MARCNSRTRTPSSPAKSIKKKLSRYLLLKAGRWSRPTRSGFADHCSPSFWDPSNLFPCIWVTRMLCCNPHSGGPAKKKPHLHRIFLVITHSWLTALMPRVNQTSSAKGHPTGCQPLFFEKTFGLWIREPPARRTEKKLLMQVLFLTSWKNIEACS